MELNHRHRDLRKWVQSYFSGRIINIDNVNRAIDPNYSPVGYGHGYYAGFKQRGLRKIFHGGGIHGYSCFLVHYPDIDTTIVVFIAANLPSKDDITVERISDRVAELILWQQMEPRKLQLIDTGVDPGTYKDHIGTYTYPTTLNGLITLQKNKLYYRLDKPGKKKVELLPMGDDKFFAKSPKLEIHFLRDSSGNIEGFVHFQEGSQMTTTRVH